MAEINTKEKKKFTQMLGKNIKKIRKQRGLTLRELAKKVDYTTGYIGLLEQGKSVPNSFILKKLSEALNVPISVIYGEKEAIEKTKGFSDPILTNPDNKEYLQITKELISKGIEPEQFKKTIEFLASNS